MVTNNKVLTVSYGTFSCTLEGFEDSFDTMKAIAEYFRDLASDDRYFGAEPPTPDAEMLARIAEREIERRVSARMDHGAIVLSATDRVDATEAPTKNVAPENVAEEPQEEIAAKDAVAESTAEADKDRSALKTGGIAAAAAAAAAVIAEDNAEDTDVVDEVAESAADETQGDAIEASLEVAAEETSVEDVAEAVAEEVVSEDDAPDTSEDEADAAVQDAVAEADLEGAPVAEIEDAVEVTAVEDAVEEIAEDIQDEASEVDLQAVMVETAEEVSFEEADDDADEDVFDAIAADDVLVLQDSIKAALADDGIVAQDAPETEAIDIASVEVLDPVVDEFEDDADDWAEEEPTSDYEENSIAAKLERIRAVVSRSSDSADDDDFSEDEHARDLAASDEAPVAAFDAQDEALTEDIFAADQADEDDEILSNDLDDAEDQAEADAKPALRARVVRMKKADFQEAVASGLLEAEPVDEDEDDAVAEEEDTFAPVAQSVDVGDSSLTPEDEADLMAELAQVEAELKGDIAANAAPSADVAAEEAPAVKAMDDYAEDAAYELDEADDLSTGIDEAEVETPTSGDAAHGAPDLSRLMAKANSEMEEPEGSRRRRAIAHLRAAVAATRAEKAAGAGAVDKDDTVAYRDDLASVVRAVPGGKDQNAGDAKSVKATKRTSVAPLKLVAEQRVDAEPEAPAAEVEATPAAQDNPTSPRVPVRPRRVSSDRKDRDEIARAAAPVGSVSSVQGGFADYAQTVGAEGMPQILEAAAAYVTFVKGQERFSRPMLMRMARDANEAEFSREEGLRSFGQLLRDQKIRKIAGGRFTADESINFKPEDRAAG